MIKQEDLIRITSILSEPTDPRLIKQREQGSGRNKVTLSYVTGPVVIDQLNRAFSHLWNIEMVDQWVQPSVSKEKKVWDEVNRRQIATGEMDEQNPVAHVKVRLTVLVPNDDGTFTPIIKEAYGCQSVIGGQSEQENIFKGAATDALKKAAQNLGIALDLARSQEAQDYFNEMIIVPWTAEELSAHQKEIDYVQSIFTENQLSSEEIDSYVYTWSEGVITSYAQIRSDSYTAFYSWLKSQVETEATEEMTDGANNG